MWGAGNICTFRVFYSLDSAALRLLLQYMSVHAITQMITIKNLQDRQKAVIENQMNALKICDIVRPQNVNHNGEWRLYEWENQEPQGPPRRYQMAPQQHWYEFSLGTKAANCEFFCE